MGMSQAGAELDLSLRRRARSRAGQFWAALRQPNVGLLRVFTSNDERASTVAHSTGHHDTRRRRSAFGGLPPITRSNVIPGLLSSAAADDAPDIAARHGRHH